MMTRAELDALVLGDEVAWKQNRDWRITKVKAIAATSIVTADHQRWTKKFGKQFACGSARIYLERVTPEIREAVVKQEAVTRLHRIEWERHDLATLRAVAVILEASIDGHPAESLLGGALREAAVAAGVRHADVEMSCSLKTGFFLKAPVIVGTRVEIIERSGATLAEAARRLAEACMEARGA
jgi:hypothetical protein